MGSTDEAGAAPPEDTGGAEYVAEDDRRAATGYCALSRHPTAPAPGARAQEARGAARPAAEDDGA
jgi:hypothetical protein